MVLEGRRTKKKKNTHTIMDHQIPPVTSQRKRRGGWTKRGGEGKEMEEWEEGEGRKNEGRGRKGSVRVGNGKQREGRVMEGSILGCYRAKVLSIVECESKVVAVADFVSLNPHSQTWLTGTLWCLVFKRLSILDVLQWFFCSDTLVRLVWELTHRMYKRAGDKRDGREKEKKPSVE